MALRRELLPILLAAVFLLLGPGQALAAPTWLNAEPLNAPFAAPFTPPAVATDADGNSIAAWTVQDGSGGDVRALYRPRGGPWEATTVEIEPDYPVLVGVATRAVVLPDGSFVVVWIADRNNDSDPVLRSATRSPSGEWTTVEVRDLTCCTLIDGLEAGADGTVMVISQEAGGSVSNTKASASAPWGPPQQVGIGTPEGFALEPDGGAVAVSGGVCGESSCIRASYRPPGGDWGGQETVGITDDRPVLGLAVAANPDGSATAVWGVGTSVSETTAPPSDVFSADRAPGPGGGWSAADLVAHLEFDLLDCGLRCIDVATGADGAQLTAWPQSGESGDLVGAAVRSAGGDWAGPETAGPAAGNKGPARVTITTSGVPVVAWSSSANNRADANASHRDAAGDWHPVVLGSSQDDTVYLDDLEADGDGNALTAFMHRGGIFAAGFDGGGPRFSAFNLPTGGSAGQSLAFSAAADDNWSAPASISWLFGDGGGGLGGAVSHVYGAAGSYTATAGATDAVGNATQRSGTVPVAAPPPPPDPCGTADTDKDGIKNGCDDNNGAKRPVPFKTVNATVVSGDVFVKLPAGSASASQAKPPKGFKRLEGAETIPVGSTLDTARGRVKIRSAADTRRKTQTGQFYRGRFVIRQARIKRRSRKLITDMRLNGSSFKKRCRATASVSQKRRKRSKRKVRRLFGDAKGSFRTSGRNAAATVRGTRWGVQDRCDGTLVAVQRGRVEVRDKVKRKTIILRRGRTYLARAR